MDPMEKTLDDYKDVIDKIGKDTSVGIDAQLTHAMILDYLMQLTQRIQKIEKLLSQKKQ